MPKALVTGKIIPDSVLELLGGKWPGSFGAWKEVECFRITGPDTIQGYDGYGEPIGPGFRFTISPLGV